MGKLIPYKSLDTLRKARELDEHRNLVVAERRKPLQLASDEARLARWQAKNALALAAQTSERASDRSLRTARNCGRV